MDASLLTGHIRTLSNARTESRAHGKHPGDASHRLTRCHDSPGTIKCTVHRLGDLRSFAGTDGGSPSCSSSADRYLRGGISPSDTLPFTRGNTPDPLYRAIAFASYGTIRRQADELRSTQHAGNYNDHDKE